MGSEKYKDDYRDALMEVIEEKVESGGKEIEEKPKPKKPSSKVIDLVAVLQESLNDKKSHHARKKSAPQRVTVRPRNSFCSGSRVGCRTRYNGFWRYAISFSGCCHRIIMTCSPPSHFNISPFRRLFPDDLDDVHSILLPAAICLAQRFPPLNHKRGSKGSYRRCP